MPMWMVLTITLPLILTLGALYLLQWTTNNTLKHSLMLWQDEVRYLSGDVLCFCECNSCGECYEKLPY